MKNKIKGLKLINYTLNNFRFNIKSVLYFEICYKLLTMFIFIPLNHFIINNFMHSEGIYTLTNKDFLKFGLSPIGVASAILILAISFVVIFIEISVLTYIAFNSHKKNKITLIDGIFNSFGILPKVIGKGLIPLFLVTVVIGPLIGIGLCSTLIKKLSIPAFITIELSKTLGGKIIYIGIFLILTLLLFRWILAIPQIIIENKQSNQCLKESKTIYKENKKIFFKYIGSWIFVNFIINIFMTIVFIFLGIFLSIILSQYSLISKIFIMIFILLYYIISIIISLIMMPLFISFLVEMFYQLKDNEVNERDFSSYKNYSKNKLYIFLNKWRKIYLNLSIAIFVIINISIGLNIISNKVIEKQTLITAHRGSSLIAPENSISSIRGAISEKSDFAEIDVQTTKDDVVVLFHDPSLKRINKSSKSIKDLTYDEVLSVDNGSYFSEKFKDEKIPTLEEVLKEAKGKIKLNIELKPMKENDNLSNEAVKLIKKYNMEDDVVITSTNYETLQEVKAIDSTLKTGYIVIAAIGNIQNLNVDFLSVENSLLKPNLVYAMHALGKEVHGWTLNDDEDIDQALELGVDNIITDNVYLVKNTKDILNSKEMNFATFYVDSIINISKYLKI